MALVTKEVVESGYPVLSISSTLRQRYFTTSEFVPYYFALFMHVSRLSRLNFSSGLPMSSLGR